jgi:hypothetical protein
MAEDEKGTAYFPLVGAKFAIPSDRPDLMLVDLQTQQGPLRFATSKELRSALHNRSKLKPKNSHRHAQLPKAPEWQTVIEVLMR